MVDGRVVKGGVLVLTGIGGVAGMVETGGIYVADGGGVDSAAEGGGVEVGGVVDGAAAAVVAVNEAV